MPTRILKKIRGRFTRKRAIEATIIPPALILMITTFLSKFLGMGKEVVFSSKFGTALDAYNAAFRVPDILTQVFVIGGFSSAFIPVFAGMIKKKQFEKAWKLSSVVTSVLLILIIGFSIGIFIFAPFIVRYLLAPGFDEVTRAETVKYLRIFLFSPLLLGLSAVFTGVLNSYHRFAASAFAPVMYNIGIILGALVFEPFFGKVWGLSLGVVFGAFMHMAIQVYPVTKTGFRWKWDPDFKNKDLQRIASLGFPRMIGSSAMQIDMYVDTYLSSTLMDGSLTMLGYAQRLQSFPVGLFGSAIATASFPKLSGYASINDQDGFLKQFFRSFTKILYFTIPLSIGFVVMRVEIVRMIFGLTGKVDWVATRSIAFALALYSISIFAQAGNYLLNRAFYSLHDTKTPVIASLISVGLNTFLSILLIMVTPHFSMLALSFTIASLVNFLLLGTLFYTKLRNPHFEEFSKTALAIVLGVVVMGLSLWGFETFLSYHVFDIRNVVELFASSILCFIFALVVYVSSVEIFGGKQIGTLLKYVKRKHNDND